MLVIVTLLLGLASIGVFLLATFLLLQVSAAAFARCQSNSSDSRYTEAADDFEAAPLAILIPAYNEEAVLAETISSVRSQLTPGDRLIVVADNCTDRSAAIARELGATVVERSDRDKRGKGFALDYGVKALSDNPPQILVVVDADCSLAPFALARLRQAVFATGQPMQALYMMNPPVDPALRQRVSAFAWHMKNEVRALGSSRLGLPCQLQGSGFALPWKLVERINFASDNIVEDMQMGVDLALLDSPVRFCPVAVVSSVFPGSEAAAASQRTRWEHGHIATLLSQVPRLLLSAIARRRVALAGSAFDLAIPPLALFALIHVALLLSTSLAAAFSGVTWPFYVSLCSLALFSVGVMVAWWQVGRQFLSLWDLASVPWYIVSKLPIYLGFLTNRQRAWVRTERDERP